MALTEWVALPHLQNFIPFNPSTSMDDILCLSPLWQTYQPLFPSLVQRWQTLFPLAIALDLPRLTSYACIHHWSGDNLILASHHHFQPSILPVIYDLALFHTTLPPDCKCLDWAIRHSLAIGVSNGSYLPR